MGTKDRKDNDFGWTQWAQVTEMMQLLLGTGLISKNIPSALADFNRAAMQMGWGRAPVNRVALMLTFLSSLNDSRGLTLDWESFARMGSMVAQMKGRAFFLQIDGDHLWRLCGEHPPYNEIDGLFNTCKDSHLFAYCSDQLHHRLIADLDRAYREFPLLKLEMFASGSTFMIHKLSYLG